MLDIRKVEELTNLVFAINCIASANSASCRTASKRARASSRSRRSIAPLCATLPVWAISRHVTSVATDSADDVCGEVALLGAVVLPVADLATILASLVLVVTERTVKSRKLSQLVTLELVLAFRNRRSLEILDSESSNKGR